MRVRMHSSILICALLCSVSLALPSPNVWWDRADPGAAYAEWGFDTGDNPALPENYDTPGGDPPEAAITVTGDVYGTAGWYESFLGRDGVWHGDLTEISLTMSNYPQPNEFKEIWVEVGFRGFLIDYSIDDPLTGVTYLGQDVEFLPDGWKILNIGWQIVPNPPSETIYMMFEDSGADIDYVTVDTICIPEPLSIFLLGLGALALRRRR